VSRTIFWTSTLNIQMGNSTTNRTSTVYCAPHYLTIIPLTYRQTSRRSLFVNKYIQFLARIKTQHLRHKEYKGYRAFGFKGHFASSSLCKSYGVVFRPVLPYHTPLMIGFQHFQIQLAHVGTKNNWCDGPCSWPLCWNLYFIFFWPSLKRWKTISLLPSSRL